MNKNQSISIILGELFAVLTHLFDCLIIWFSDLLRAQMKISHHSINSLSDLVMCQLISKFGTHGHAMIDRLYGLKKEGDHLYRILLVNDLGEIDGIGCDSIPVNLDLVRECLNAEDNTDDSVIKILEGSLEEVFTENKKFRQIYRTKIYLLDFIPTLESEAFIAASYYVNHECSPRNLLLSFLYNKLPDPVFFEIAKTFLVDETNPGSFKGRWRDVEKIFGSDSKRILEDTFYQSVLRLLSINVAVVRGVVTIEAPAARM